MRQPKNPDKLNINKLVFHIRLDISKDFSNWAIPMKSTFKFKKMKLMAQNNII